MNTHETNNSQTHEKEVPTVDELLDSLSDRFRRDEMPHTLNELHELADEVNAETKERGFSNPTSYVDADGELIVIARKEGDSISRDDQPSVDKTCRILFDEKIVEVVIPPEWQVKTLHFRSSYTIRDTIYNVTDVDPNSLPDDMKLLVGKFGPKLSREISITKPSEYAYRPSYINGVAIGLEDIAASVEVQRTRITSDEQEAYVVEDDAKAAAGRVQKGLFTSAKKLAALQEAAYRESINKPVK